MTIQTNARAIFRAIHIFIVSNWYTC